jgi:hypothetical protein
MVESSLAANVLHLGAFASRTTLVHDARTTDSGLHVNRVYCTDLQIALRTLYHSTAQHSTLLSMVSLRVPYKSVDDVDIPTDIYLPAPGTETQSRAAPVLIMCVHSDLNSHVLTTSAIGSTAVRSCLATQASIARTKSRTAQQEAGSCLL